MPLTRRRLLGTAAAAVGVVGLGAVGVETGVLPGRTRAYDVLGLNGSGGSVPPVAGELVTGSFRSTHRSAEVGWGIAYPPGSATDATLPVVIALHGRGETHAVLFGDRLGLDHFLAAAVAGGSPPYAIAAVDGGDTYWHPRASGEDAGALVTDEFLPVLAARGLRANRTDRIGMYGFSMGGYGVLRLAGLLGPDRVAAVVATSAALWTAAGDTAPGAFDDAADFAAHDVFGRQGELDGITVRLDCGRGDSFQAAVHRYRDGFATGHRPAGGFQAGGHDEGYWRRQASAELAFLGDHLR